VLGLDRCSPLDTDNENELVLSRNIVGALLLAQAVKADLLALCITVFFDVGLGTLEDDSALLFVGLCCDISQQRKFSKLKEVQRNM